jgi:hypothetical protein
MATTNGIIDSSVHETSRTHRRGLALAIAAALLVGGGVATAAVTMNSEDVTPPPVHDLSSFDGAHIGGTLAPSDVGGRALPSNGTSREYSARQRVLRLSGAR